MLFELHLSYKYYNENLTFVLYQSSNYLSKFTIYLLSFFTCVKKTLLLPYLSLIKLQILPYTKIYSFDIAISITKKVSI